MHEKKPPQATKLEHPTSEVLPVEDAIEEVLKGKVQKRDLPQVAAQLTQIVVSEQFRGPLPHPKHFREYEAIHPGATERLFQMAETNMQHAMEMDRKAINAEIEDQKLGMKIGAGLFALLIGAAILTVYWEAPQLVTGLFLGTAAIGGVSLFIRGRNGKQ